MEFYVEARDPQRDLGGLCECFIAENQGLCTVARPHVHQYFELLYCLCGEYELSADHQRYTLRAGDAALIHPMTPHQTRTLTQDKSSYLVLKFTPDALYSGLQPFFELQYIFPYLHAADAHAHFYYAQTVSQSDLYHLLLCILEERTRQEYGYEMAVRAYISQVLLWFIRMWHRHRGIQAMDAKLLPRLQSALGYIDAHLEEPITAQAIADALSMGLSTFSRFFSNALGMTLPSYIRQRRLGRAATMLVSNEQSITEIALECGFSTASYLIACFKSQYGVTPSRFRRLYTGISEIS